MKINDFDILTSMSLILLAPPYENKNMNKRTKRQRKIDNEKKTILFHLGQWNGVNRYSCCINIYLSLNNRRTYCLHNISKSSLGWVPILSIQLFLQTWKLYGNIFRQAMHWMENDQQIGIQCFCNKLQVCTAILGQFVTFVL